MAIIRSQCGQCAVGCGVRVVTDEAQRTLRVEGDPVHPANGGLLCPRVGAIEAAASTEGRLLHPLLHGRRQRWDRVIGQLARRWEAILTRHGAGRVALHVGGGLLTEDYYVANKLIKGFCGSAHVHAPWMGPVPALQRAAFGEDVVPVAAEDIDRARIILIVGDGAALDYPVLIDRVQAARGDGGAILIQIGSQQSAGAGGADLVLRVPPGAEAVLLNGLLLHCLDQGLSDPDGVARSIGMPDGFADALRPGHDIWSVARACGVAPAAIRDFYDLWTGNHACLTISASQQEETIAALLNLHLATGRIGRPGAGPFLLASRANAMGARETGCMAAMLAAHMDFAPAALARTARFWGARMLAREPGLEGEALLRAMRDGQIHALWSMGADAESADWLREARRIVPLSIRATQDAGEAGDGWSALLPSAAWVEKDGTLTGADRLISRQRRLFDLPGEARPDWWMLTRLAQAMGWADAFHYEQAADIYREHVRLTAYQNDGERLLNLRRHAPISNPAYAELTPWRWGGVPFDEGRFPTGDGRARLLPPGQVRPAIP